MQHLVYGGILLDPTSLIIHTMMMYRMLYVYNGFAYTSNTCSANGVILSRFCARPCEVAGECAGPPCLPALRFPRPWIMVVRLTYLIL